MNKTSIVHTLPCGCRVRQWAFGREHLRRCAKHPPRGSVGWSLNRGR